MHCTGGSRRTCSNKAGNLQTRQLHNKLARICINVHCLDSMYGHPYHNSLKTHSWNTGYWMQGCHMRQERGYYRSGSLHLRSCWVSVSPEMVSSRPATLATSSSRCLISSELAAFAPPSSRPRDEISPRGTEPMPIQFCYLCEARSWRNA